MRGEGCRWRRRSGQTAGGCGRAWDSQELVADRGQEGAAVLPHPSFHAHGTLHGRARSRAAGGVLPAGRRRGATPPSRLLAAQAISIPRVKGWGTPRDAAGTGLRPPLWPLSDFDLEPAYPPSRPWPAPAEPCGLRAGRRVGGGRSAPLRPHQAGSAPPPHILGRPAHPRGSWKPATGAGRGIQKLPGPPCPQTLRLDPREAPKKYCNAKKAGLGIRTPECVGVRALD